MRREIVILTRLQISLAHTPFSLVLNSICYQMLFLMLLCLYKHLYMLLSTGPVILNLYQLEKNQRASIISTQLDL